MKARTAPPDPLDEAAAANREIIAQLSADPWLAHNYLFPHRHKERSCLAHRKAVEALHGTQPRLNLQAFRGFGKSTLTEESIVIQAAFQRFKNKLIVGASERRAIERLASVKREFEQNEYLAGHFGELRGPVWQESKIVLANGICIQAVGRDQSLRGVKHLDTRPDAVLIDDIEDQQEVRSPGGRQKTRDWLRMELIPALDDPVLTPVHVLGTPMDPESLVIELERMGWPTLKFPAEYLDEAGERRATWPGKFPLDKLAELRKTVYQRDMTGWEREYMLHPVSDADRTFTPEMIRLAPRVRTWEATFAMYDPARTTNKGSATTGMVVFSWIANRLVIWKSSAQRWMPDEIIGSILAICDEFDPVWIGIEENGLEEFIKQPLRHEQAKRNALVPIKPMRAPRDKFGFIRFLQPYFKAGEVDFVGSGHEDMIAQLLSFPTGEIDGPNALAYAVPLRPAAPIYDGFTLGHVADSVLVERHRDCFLAFNATKAMSTVVVVQYLYGRIRILADFAAEGEPREVVPLLVREAAMLTRTSLKAVVGPLHFDQWNNVGLVQALQKIPLVVDRGTDPGAGREVLREEFGRSIRGEPAVQIGRQARYTLNGLSGGYTRSAMKGGVLSMEPEPGLYRTLMEGLESCLGSLATAETDDAGAFSYTADGRRYRRYGNPHLGRESYR